MERWQLHPDAISGLQQLYQTWKEIESTRVQITALEEEIHRASASLHKLRANEKHLLTLAAATAPLLSPFQRLPRDLIGEIAGHVAVNSFDEGIGRQDRGLWPLLYVSKAWSSAVISLPRIWSSFLLRNGKNCELPPTGLVSAILKRSGTCPLSFSFIVENSHNIQPTLSLLVQHSERWRSVRLQGPMGPAPLLDLHHRLPLLEYLALDLCEPEKAEERWTGSEAEQRIFEDTPKLISLECGKSRSLQGQFKFKFPQHQLHKVVTCWNSWNVTTGLGPIHDLPLMHRLVDLHICDAFRQSRRPLRPIKAITLPSLKHLSIESDLMLLGAFRTPALESLGLSKVDFNLFGLPDIRRFLDSIPDGQVQMLRVSSTGGHRDGARVMALISLSTFQHIDTFSYKDCARQEDIDDSEKWIKSFLSFLTHLNSKSSKMELEPATPFLPRLQHFKLTLTYDLERADLFGPIKDFVNSRTRAVEETASGEAETVPSTLESLCVEYSSGLPPLTLSDFETNGLEVDGKSHANAIPQPRRKPRHKKKNCDDGTCNCGILLTSIMPW